MNALVATIEAEATLLPAPEPMVPAPQQAPLHLADVPAAPVGRQPALRVEVRRKWYTAAGVAAFEVAPISGVLPTFQPGRTSTYTCPTGWCASTRSRTAPQSPPSTASE